MILLVLYALEHIVSIFQKGWNLKSILVKLSANTCRFFILYGNYLACLYPNFHRNFRGVNDEFGIDLIDSTDDFHQRK